MGQRERVEGGGPVRPLDLHSLQFARKLTPVSRSLRISFKLGEVKSSFRLIRERRRRRPSHCFVASRKIVARREIGFFPACLRRRRSSVTSTQCSRSLRHRRAVRIEFSPLSFCASDSSVCRIKNRTSIVKDTSVIFAASPFPPPFPFPPSLSLALFPSRRKYGIIELYLP